MYVPGDSVNTTIQSAINAAAKNPRAGVWIKADYAGSDTYTNPSGVPVFDLRGTGTISLTATSAQARPTITGGTVLTSGNFTLTGWGSGATITAIHGSDAAHYFTITAGSSPSQSPTVKLTYADGAWGFAPVIDALCTTGSGAASDIGVSTLVASYTLTYLGDVLNGSTYVFRVTAIQPVS